jgi:DNA polymerase II small subunit/DNA polymerase delta subunit B
MQLKWDILEPNLESATKKNKNRICAMHNCQNKLSNPPAYGYLGVKVCDEHGKYFDEMREDILKDVYEDTDRWILETIKSKI